MTRPPPITAHRARQPQQRHAARVLSCADTGAGHQAVAVPHPRNLVLLLHQYYAQYQDSDLDALLGAEGDPKEGFILGQLLQGLSISLEAGYQPVAALVSSS